MRSVDKVSSELSFKELSVELTHKCPLSCVYCSSSSDFTKDEHINMERLLQVIMEVKNKFGVNTISLSGGETFLYPHFSELYDFLANEEFKILIYTSGITLDGDGNRVSLLNDFLKELRLQKDNPKLFLNVQGHNKALVERINRLLGSHQLIEESIDNILSAGLYLGAHIVPFKANYKYIQEIFKYCSNKRLIEIGFLRFVPQGRGVNRNLYNTKEEFAHINHSIEQILRRIQNEKINIDIRLGHPINFLFLTGQERLYNKEKTHYCRGGLDAPLILPNGDVSMCPAWKNLKEFSAGNIYKEDFEEIWNSYSFRTFRNFVNQGYKDIKEPCHSCKYLEDCRAKCVAQRLLTQRASGSKSKLEESILIAPDPQCFKNIC